MKKVLGIFVLSMFIISMGAGIVSADIGQDIADVIEGTIKAINPVTKQILGDTKAIKIGKDDWVSEGELLFAKLLFFIIILSIVWGSLSSIDFFSNAEWMLWLISISVAILSTRFLGTEAVGAILLPYSALGVAITAGLPFVIYFIVVNVAFKTQPSIVRKTAWIFFAIIFTGIWFVRGNDVAETVRWIYPVTAIASVVMAMMDGTIQKWRNKMRIEAVGQESSEKAIEEILKKKNELSNLLSQGIINEMELKKREKKYNKQMAALYK